VYDSTMTTKRYVCCCQCSYEGSGVKIAVERTNATDGAYHVFTACADAEACQERGVQAKAREQKA